MSKKRTATRRRKNAPQVRARYLRRELGTRDAAKQLKVSQKTFDKILQGEKPEKAAGKRLYNSFRRVSYKEMREGGFTRNMARKYQGQGDIHAKRLQGMIIGAVKNQNIDKDEAVDFLRDSFKRVEAAKTPAALSKVWDEVREFVSPGKKMETGESRMSVE